MVLPVSGFLSLGQDLLQCGQVHESTSFVWHLLDTTLRTLRWWRASSVSAAFCAFSLSSFLLCLFKSFFSRLSFFLRLLSRLACCLFDFLSAAASFFDSSSASDFLLLFLFFKCCLRLVRRLSRLRTRSRLLTPSPSSVSASASGS